MSPKGLTLRIAHARGGTLVLNNATLKGTASAGCAQALPTRKIRRLMARLDAREAKKETARLGNQTSRAESKATSDHAASNLSQRETQHHEFRR